jgi:CRP/FNR family transcriptional regulator, cyclic AMP receptor protein
MDAAFNWENLFRRKEEKDVRTLLRSIPVFEGLSERDLRAMERILHRRSYSAGEPVFRAGDPGLGMYIIEEGSVSILLEEEGHELARLGSGEFFGEMSLFSDDPRAATAVTLEETKLFGFFEPDLAGLLQRHPRIGVHVLTRFARILSLRLARATRENAELTDKLRNAE